MIVDFYDDDFAFLQGRKKNFTPVVEKGSSFISDHLLKWCINKLKITCRGQIVVWLIKGFCFNWSHCIAVMYCLVFCIGLFVPEHLLALELSWY